MRILLVNRHFGNDQVPTGRMAADLAAALARADHDVLVVSARSSYAGRQIDNRPQNTATYELWTPGERFRLLSWVIFLAQAWPLIPFIRWDRCVFLTDPPFLAAATLLLSPLRNGSKRLFWWTMDLYPEILVSTGRVRESGFAFRILHSVNEKIIRRVAGVIALGQCQVERLRKYTSWQSVRSIIVPPWDNRAMPYVAPDKNRFLSKYSLSEKKVALYAGNLGEGHTFTQIVKAAECLEQQNRNDWSFVFVIRGSKKSKLIEASVSLKSILVLDYQPADWTPDLLWSASVHLITMNEQSKGVVVPSKLYGVLHTAAPVLFIGPEGADTALEIDRYGAGESLGNSANGYQVVETLDRLYTLTNTAKNTRIPIGYDGPDQIAKFVCGE